MNTETLKGSVYILTSDLAATFYAQYERIRVPPFSVWLEDVFVGMLALLVSSSSSSSSSPPYSYSADTDADIFYDLASYCVAYDEMSVAEKRERLEANGIQSTLFVWEYNESDYFWRLIQQYEQYEQYNINNNNNNNNKYIKY